MAPKNRAWVILPVGRARYSFTAFEKTFIEPSLQRAETKIPDATPGVIGLYALSDEQALLAKLRYNRLVDIFTGVTCYQLQSHLRTTVPDMGQVETDEIYIGVDRRGAHYVVTVQAKGGKDKLGVVQIVQDFALARAKFPSLQAVPIAAQFMEDDLIAMLSFENTDDGPRVASERHYRLVPPDEVTEEDLEAYRMRPIEG